MFLGAKEVLAALAEGGRLWYGASRAMFKVHTVGPSFFNREDSGGIHVAIWGRSSAVVSPGIVFLVAAAPEAAGSTVHLAIGFL